MAVPGNSTVRWFTSAMAGAPQIQSGPGNLIGILDACLIHGFGIKAPDGDQIAVINETATIHFSSGHDFGKHAVIAISGAGLDELNDVWRITATTSTTASFDCPGLPDGIVTGAISVKRASPGYWQKAFSDSNKAAYRSTHPHATGFYLRLDDTPALTANVNVRAYESMTDVDTGEHMFPTTEQESTLFWRRSSTTTASALPRPWALVADEAWFCFFVDWFNGSAYSAAMYQFGDTTKPPPNDDWACYITGHMANAGAPSDNTRQNEFSGQSQGMWFARPPDGVLPAPAMRMHGFNTHSDGKDFPFSLSGSLAFHVPVIAVSGSSTSFISSDVRGLLPFLVGLVERNAMIDHIRTQSGGRENLVIDPDPAHPMPIFVHAITRGQSTSDSLRRTYIGLDIEGPWR